MLSAIKRAGTLAVPIVLLVGMAAPRVYFTGWWRG